MNGILVVEDPQAGPVSYGLCHGITTTATHLSFTTAVGTPVSLPIGQVKSFTVTPQAPGDGE
jgi:hypothetical protein